MREIEFYAGDNIDTSMARLYQMEKKFGETCFGKFNGHELLSTDSIDDAYQKVLGRTKAEFDKELKEEREEYERELSEHNARIPELSEKYRKEARGVILEDEYEYWDKIVPVRLKDLYRGMELENTLELCRIMRKEELPYDDRLRAAYDFFMASGHSGMSASLVASMLRRFCPNGNDLADAVMSYKFEKSQQ